MCEAQFDKVPGVLKTTVGYTGGANPKPSYETVCGGDGHTEVVFGFSLRPLKGYPDRVRSQGGKVLGREWPIEA